MEAIEGLLYPYALDKGGSIVKAVDAPRSEIYSCIACGERMVLRRGEIKRPHFAHHTENPNCTPETVLHKMAKDSIREGIENAMSLRLKYPFTWDCPVCKQSHKGNLTRRTREVKTEVNLDGVRPDILITSMKEKPLVAIEVIVTHSPEQEAIEAYKRLKIPVLLVEPWWEDLEKFKRGLGLVEAWQAPCKAKPCPECGGPMEEVVAGLFIGPKCFNCGKKIPVFSFVKYGAADLQDWTPGMFEPALSLGVRIKKTSMLFGPSYAIAIMCPYCETFAGANWYFHDWFNSKFIQGKAPVKTKPYYRCRACDLWIEKIEEPTKSLEGGN